LSERITWTSVPPKRLRAVPTALRVLADEHTGLLLDRVQGTRSEDFRSES